MGLINQDIYKIKALVKYIINSNVDICNVKFYIYNWLKCINLKVNI